MRFPFLSTYYKKILLMLVMLVMGVNYGQKTVQDQWNAYYKLGRTAYKAHNYQEASHELLKAYEWLVESRLEEGHEMIDTQYYLGRTYLRLKKFDEAIPHLKKSLDDLSLIQENKRAVLRRYYFVGADYEKLSRNIEAINIWRKGLEYSKKYLENNQDVYILFLRSLAKVHNKIGKNDLATINLLEAISYQKAMNEPPTKEIAVDLTNLAQFYIALNKLTKASEAQEESLSLFETTHYESINYAGALFALGKIHFKRNDYQSAIRSYNKAKEILKLKNSPGYFSVINDLGQVYDRLGDFEKSLILNLEALENVAKDNRQYENSLQNVAFAYGKLGQFDKAEAYYMQAKQIFETKYSTEHPLYGILLNNIGKLYLQQRAYDEALIFFDQALDIHLKHKDESNIDYAYLLDDYAKTLLVKNKNDEAIGHMEQNLELAVKNKQTNTESFYNRQYSLARAYNKVGRYKEALPLLLNATEKIKALLGESHTDFGKMINALSSTYVGLGKYEEALFNLELANRISINKVEEVFKFSSENEKKAFVNLIRNDFDQLQKLSLKELANYQKIHEINLNNQLVFKGLLLNNSKDIISGLNKLKQADIVKEIQAYRLSKNVYNRTLTLPFEDRNMNLDSLKIAINEQEANLVKRYNNNYSKQGDLVKSWREAQSQLQNDEIVIEFSHFRNTSLNQLIDSTMYVAYIYNNKSDFPLMVPLFEERELEKLLKKKNPNQLYAKRGSTGRNSGIRGIYNLVWKPIEAHLPKGTTIYYSPSGLLNQIPFAALGKKGNKLLSEKYQMIQLSSSAVLIDKLEEPNMDSTLLIGGIVYDFDPKGKPRIDNNSRSTPFMDYKSFKESAANRSRGKQWDYLPGTLMEVDSLKALFTENDKKSEILSGLKASEVEFKKLSGSGPSVLHIATHGFFYENLNNNIRDKASLNGFNQYQRSEDPLLRSGLILAGGNYAWENDKNPYEKEDGILTALEISNMDLSNTDMVVLSACETGLGDINGSEGVYGLQRAFKMAGVRLIVMSLWEVPDIETAEFMQGFYQQWLNDNDIRSAFNLTQKSMQKKYKEEPLKWAAFVLLE